MSKLLLQQINPHTALYRDTRTGIAFVENGSTGSEHSAHPNIDASGSVSGMKKRGYWGKEDRTVRSRGAIYNIDLSVITDDLDQLAADNCECGGKHPPKAEPVAPAKPRYGVVLQVCQFDDEGEVTECYTVQGPTLATTDIEAAKLIADAVEAAAHDTFRSIAKPETISPLYPN